MGMGVGPRKGDSDISDGCWLLRNRLRESPTVGVIGVAEDDEAAKSSERAAVSRCRMRTSAPVQALCPGTSNLGLYLLKLRPQISIV